MDNVHIETWTENDFFHISYFISIVQTGFNNQFMTFYQQ